MYEQYRVGDRCEGKYPGFVRFIKDQAIVEIQVSSSDYEEAERLYWLITKATLDRIEQLELPEFEPSPNDRL